MFLKRIFLILSIIIANECIAQYDVETVEKDSVSGEKKDNLISAIKENTYFGSGANLLIGNQLFLYLSPQIGYEFLPNFSAGFLSSIQYSQFASYKETALGVGIFSRYVLFDKLIFESSLNFYRIRGSFTNQPTQLELKSKSWLAGLGYARQLGNKSYAHFLVSYDILREPNNPEITLLNLPNFRIYYKFGITIYPFRK